MPKIFKDPSKIKLPRSKFEEAEFGRSKKGVTICKECDSYHHKKAWRHDKVAFLGKRENRDLAFERALCPACQMIKDKLYAGRITILNSPKDLRDELMNLTENFCKRAWQKDPLDRLISVKKDREDLVITTTENQLAQRLAKKIKDAFNKVKLKIDHHKEPSDVTTIVLTFL